MHYMAPLMMVCQKQPLFGQKGGSAPNLHQWLNQNMLGRLSKPCNRCLL